MIEKISYRTRSVQPPNFQQVGISKEAMRCSSYPLLRLFWAVAPPAGDLRHLPAAKDDADFLCPLNHPHTQRGLHISAACLSEPVWSERLSLSVVLWRGMLLGGHFSFPYWKAIKTLTFPTKAQRPSKPVSKTTMQWKITSEIKNNLHLFKGLSDV